MRLVSMMLMRIPMLATIFTFVWMEINRMKDQQGPNLPRVDDEEEWVDVV